jgi:tRNA(Ile)-lysidine synthase
VSLAARVLAAIRRHRLLDPGQRVLVAVSGGPDSLALLHVLHELSPTLDLALTVAHLEHGLRGEESVADARAVEQMAAALGLPFVMERVRLAELAAATRVSLETAGRQARYTFFERAAREAGCARVATGHTADDRVETMLLNLLRGAGLDGLRGIPRARPLGDGTVRVVRPLLDVRRAEVEAYCAAVGLTPREDATNQSLEFARNRVRHVVLPALEQEAAPGLRERLIGLSDMATEEVELLDELAAQLLTQATRKVAPHHLALAAGPLAEAPPALARRALRLAARCLGATGDIDRATTEALLRLASGDLITGITLPGARIHAARRGDTLSFTVGRTGQPSPSSPATGSQSPARLPIPGRVHALGYDFAAAIASEGEAQAGDPDRCVVMDADKLSGPLTVRAPLPGDRIRPLGMRGRRKLQDLFVDGKLPRERRGTVPVVVDDEKIVWVVGFCLSDDVRLDAGTRRVVRVEARPSEGL